MWFYGLNASGFTFKIMSPEFVAHTNLFIHGDNNWLNKLPVIGFENCFNPKKLSVCFHHAFIQSCHSSQIQLSNHVTAHIYNYPIMSQLTYTVIQSCHSSHIQLSNHVTAHRYSYPIMSQLTDAAIQSCHSSQIQLSNHVTAHRCSYPVRSQLRCELWADWMTALGGQDGGEHWLHFHNMLFRADIGLDKVMTS